MSVYTKYIPNNPLDNYYLNEINNRENTIVVNKRPNFLFACFFSKMLND